MVQTTPYNTIKKFSTTSEKGSDFKILKSSETPETFYPIGDLFIVKAYGKTKDPVDPCVIRALHSQNGRHGGVLYKKGFWNLAICRNGKSTIRSETRYGNMGPLHKMPKHFHV